jgi:hypothetical protein
MPFQPAFGITGHSAQGKTLPEVIASLHEGGFAAYVAASRPRRRESLFITEPVTLQQLNKPLPDDLIFEMDERLSAIEHNTMVKYGYLEGSPVVVPDAEGENQITAHKYKFHYKDNSARTKLKTPSTPRKPKKSDDTPTDKESPTKRKNSIMSTGIIPAFKKVRIFEPQPSVAKRYTYTLFDSGCIWNSVDYSCAYDSLVMVLFSAYQQATPVWKSQWEALNEWTTLLGSNFRYILNAGYQERTVLFNEVRDLFRTKLNAMSSTQFPMYGPALVSVGAVTDIIHRASRYLTCIVECIRCTLCHAAQVVNTPSPVIHLPSGITAHSVPSIISPDTIRPHSAVSLPLETILQEHMPHASMEDACSSCSGLLSHCYVMQHAPQLLFFETSGPESLLQVNADLQLTLPSLQGSPNICYVLRGIVYAGGAHFTACLFGDTTAWKYDGQCNNGAPEEEGLLTSINLENCDERKAAVLVYAKTG